jgi:dihydrodipicolinate synthase/N-acetylneuraminate lyase
MKKTGNLPSPLCGIIPPMVTPLLDQETLDAVGLERLIEHLVGGGVHGLFLLGTNGEGPAIGYKVRRELVERTCAQVGGRVPVMVGITDTAFIESVRMAGHAADAGADAVVLAPPYYFPAGQPEILEYLERLLPRIPLPLFLYNMPTHTNFMFETETVMRAFDIEGIAGIKDSSGDMVYFQCLLELLRDRPEVSLLVGPEQLLAESVLSGGHGGVSGGANFFPALFVALYEAAVRRDLHRVSELQSLVMEIYLKIFMTGRHASRIIKGIKCVLELEGICSGFIAEPFRSFREPERDRIRKHLEEIKPKVAALVKPAQASRPEPLVAA